MAYAQQNVRPKIGVDADKALIAYYLELRETSKRRNTINAYPRQLQSLIRLSEATAKMRLKEVVDADDAAFAYKYVCLICLTYDYKAVAACTLARYAQQQSSRRQ